MSAPTTHLFHSGDAVRSRISEADDAELAHAHRHYAEVCAAAQAFRIEEITSAWEWYRERMSKPSAYVGQNRAALALERQAHIRTVNARHDATVDMARDDLLEVIARHYDKL